MIADENTVLDRPEHPVDVVERLASMNDWAFDRADEDEIRCSSPAPGRNTRPFTWLPAIEVAACKLLVRPQGSRRRRSEIVALVQLINAQLWIGHFDIWTRDDIVMFRHAHCLAGGAQPSDVQCRTIVEAALTACENYFQAFQFVLWAGRSAREAMDLAVFETKGTA